MIRACCCGCALLVLLSGSAEAQAVRGRLTTPAGTSLPAALVTLLDAQGAPVRVAVSNRGGDFSFGHVGAGRYTVRVERIGRPAATGQPFLVGPSNTVSLGIRQEDSGPVGLGSVRMGRVACAPESPGGAVGSLWAHAVRYLRVAALAEEAGLLRVRGVRYVRRLDRDYGFSTGVIEQRPFVESGMPFPPLPEGQPGGSFAGPDSSGAPAYAVAGPAALLAPGFLQAHCVYEVAEGAVPGRVGLRFRPLPDQASVGIEGVLWLDRATAELHALEYQYRDPRGELPRGAAGAVGFRVDADGFPRVSRWYVRVPLPRPAGVEPGNELLESGALALDATGVPLDDPDGVLSVLAGVVSIDSLMVEARRPEQLPDAPWRWTQGTLGGEDLEDKLDGVPLARVSAIEYSRPLEAFMIFGARDDQTSNGVILIHTRRP